MARRPTTSLAPSEQVWSKTCGRVSAGSADLRRARILRRREFSPTGKTRGKWPLGPDWVLEAACSADGQRCHGPLHGSVTTSPLLRVAISGKTESALIVEEVHR